jgi:acetolactate synthase-1/2/3 large subunit
VIVAAAVPRVAPRPRTVSDALVDLLVEHGVQHAFCVLGGSVAPVGHAFDRSAIELVHCRHESGAAFAATEAHFASGRPTVVLAVGGPGLTNALTGVLAAKWEGAKVIVISGATAAAHRGRWAFQETSAYATPLLEPAMTRAAFDLALSLDDPGELANLGARMRAGLARPQGWVAHIRLPLDAQTAAAPAALPSDGCSVDGAGCSPSVAERCARLLASAPFGIWVGFGARHAAAKVRLLAERARAKVMCTPRGKGVFPERHPSFVGVTGFGGHESVIRYFDKERPQRLLVLGTRLGEFSSFWDPRLVPPDGFIHVDVDADVPGAAFPGARVHAVHAELGAFLDAVLARFPQRDHAALRTTRPPRAPQLAATARAKRSAVSARSVMHAVQRLVIDGSDATVLSEAGNSFAWGNHVLAFATANRYRTSMGWGSMGQATAGVVGAALGRGGKAVAIVGDGAMLMNSEVSTAVQHQIPAVWIVLNDARYGMVEQGLRALGLPVAETTTAIARCNFEAIARAMGAEAIRVERERDLDAAIERAMAARGPFVVDVLVDPDEQAPLGGRLRSLEKQWSTTGGSV